MEKQKYSDRIITDTGMEQSPHEPGVKSTHVLKVDKDRLADFFSVDCTWYWNVEGERTIAGPHTAEVKRVIGIVGANPADPHDLGGEVTAWVNGEKQILNQSCLIFVPAGTSFGPVRINRLNNPMFFVTISPQQEATASPDTSDQKYSIITRTKPKTTDAAKIPTMNSTRILHIEDDMVKGAFYVDFVWLYEGYGVLPAPEHDHEWEELIAMVGADPNRPDSIGGIMSIDLEGEPYYITKNSLVCIPRKVRHCPWKFLDIRKPTLVFTAGAAGMYSSSHKDKW